jgi:hypothetical protein
VDDAVLDGTRFLVRLEDRLRTNRDKVNKSFKVRTLDPLTTAGGIVIPANAEIRGHVTRIEPAGVTGRAKLWLSFDDIRTPRGRLPLIAYVAGVPGNSNVRQGESTEGVIEARSSRSKRDLEAAAIGAGIGAAVGGVAKGGKGAAIGAAVGGLAAFVLSSGVGQDLDLPKGTKLELVLERPLYIASR